MRHIILPYKLAGLLFILMVSLPLNGICNNRLNQRKKAFFGEIEILRLHPEKISLKAKSRQYNRDSLLVYYKELQSFYTINSSRLNQWQRIAWLYETGLVQLSLEMNELSIKTFESALVLIDRKSNPGEYLRLNIELAYAYRAMGLFRKSNELYNEILKLPSVRSDSIEQMHCNYFLAENYENLGEYQRSMELCRLLYDYSLRKNDYANASYNLIQTGRMAAYLESDTSYFEYFHLANSQAVLSGVNWRIGNNLVSTGYAYNKAGYPQNALKYFKAGESLAEYSQPRDYLYCLLGLSSTYLTLDSIDEAFSYANKAMITARGIQGYQWMSESCEVIAGCFMKTEKYDSARYYLKEAIRLNKLSGMDDCPGDLYKQLSDISIKLKDYTHAVLYLDTAYAIFTSFVARTNEDKLAKLRNESDYYIHKARITELISRNKIDKEKRSRLIVLITAISVVLLLSSLFSVFRRRQMKRLRDSYIGLVRKNIELDQLNQKLIVCEARPSKRRNGDSIKDEDNILNKFRKLLQQDEIFTNPELSLKMLADELGTNTSYFSAIVNNHYNCNFKSLINKCRIDKARKMMVSDEFKHYSMDGIANEVGFKSRSGFYLAFKSVTGINPTMYIENYKFALPDLNEDPESGNTMDG